MAAGKAGRVPARLLRAAAKWAKWRRSRLLGTRIPEPLWRLAIELASQYGVSRTATTLGIDYYALKKRLEGQVSPRRVGPRTAPSFVELAPASLPAVGGCVIEFATASGAKMRIELRGSQVPDLAALGRSFWEMR